MKLSNGNRNLAYKAGTSVLVAVLEELLDSADVPKGDKDIEELIVRHFYPEPEDIRNWVACAVGGADSPYREYSHEDVSPRELAYDAIMSSLYDDFEYVLETMDARGERDLMTGLLQQVAAAVRASQESVSGIVWESCGDIADWIESCIEEGNLLDSFLW